MQAMAADAPPMPWLSHSSERDINAPDGCCHCWLQNMMKQPLHPEGNLRLRWDILLLIFLLYVCFTAPVMVCFDVSLDPDQPLWWFEIIVMFIFVLDVVLNFNTAYRGRG